MTSSCYCSKFIVWKVYPLGYINIHYKLHIYPHPFKLFIGSLACLPGGWSEGIDYLEEDQRSYYIINCLKVWGMGWPSVCAAYYLSLPFTEGGWEAYSSTDRRGGGGSYLPPHLQIWWTCNKYDLPFSVFLLSVSFFRLRVFSIQRFILIQLHLAWKQTLRIYKDIYNLKWLSAIRDSAIRYSAIRYSTIRDSAIRDTAGTALSGSALSGIAVSQCFSSQEDTFFRK